MIKHVQWKCSANSQACNKGVSTTIVVVYRRMAVKLDFWGTIDIILATWFGHVGTLKAPIAPLNETICMYMRLHVVVRPWKAVRQYMIGCCLSTVGQPVQHVVCCGPTHPSYLTTTSVSWSKRCESFKFGLPSNR